jgi:hypothetical protein
VQKHVFQPFTHTILANNSRTRLLRAKGTQQERSLSCGWAKLISYNTLERQQSFSLLNLVVDAVVHPLSRPNRGFRVLDVTLHGLIEKDLAKTTQKFIQYNLPAIIKKTRKLVE